MLRSKSRLISTRLFWPN